ncbi:hypothetical protein BJY52DRAFT_1231014 [Lactarius psammicola]|nr:hypothetical protein BJY52DRAFT_1231014 [Lactarius psammicola]
MWGSTPLHLRVALLWVAPRPTPSLPARTSSNLCAHHTRKGACVGAGGGGLTGVWGWCIPHKRWEGGARCPSAHRFAQRGVGVACGVVVALAEHVGGVCGVVIAQAEGVAKRRQTVHLMHPLSMWEGWGEGGRREVHAQTGIANDGAGCATPAPRLTHPRLLPHMPLCAYAVGAGGEGVVHARGAHGTRGGATQVVNGPGLHRQRCVLASTQRLEDTQVGRDGAGRGATQRRAACEWRGVRTGVVLPHVHVKAGGCASGAWRNPGKGHTQKGRGWALSLHPRTQ